ncbi:MAG: hypothetical protein Q7W38_01525 [Deltaproteobacteria bacterium]|nr:hypothetical protein [Deltaproteobacteria bacterium]
MGGVKIEMLVQNQDDLLLLDEEEAITELKHFQLVENPRRVFTFV